MEKSIIIASAIRRREIRIRFPHEEDCKETHPVELRIENNNVYSYMTSSQARALARALEFVASQLDEIDGL